jgi:hypothetical protein
VAIETEDRLFEPPAVPYEVSAQVGDVATLVGFDLQPGPELTVGAPVTLTLVWRAEAAAAAADLKVFTHLTAAEGTRVGQHDAKPAQWTRPTTGWVAGEIIVDEHPMDWVREDVTGPATLRIGLYDGETGATMEWQDGSHGFELPLPLTLTAADS